MTTPLTTFNKGSVKGPTPYTDSPDAWQTKAQCLMRIPFPFAWLFVAGILCFLGLAILYLCEEDFRAVWYLGIECFLIAAIANSVILYERLLDEVADASGDFLDEDSERAHAWISRWYFDIFWSWRNVVCGIFLSIVTGSMGVLVVPHLCQSFWGRAYAFFIAFAIGILGGSMMWTMIGIARLMASLGRDVRVNLSIFDTKTSALHTASIVLWKVSLTASLVFVLGISLYLFSPRVMSVVDFVVVGFFGVFIMLYFILPQMNVHKTLQGKKRKQMKALVNQIDLAFENVTCDPSAGNLNKLRDLFDLQRVVNGKSVWAFGTKEIILLVGSILIPLILFLLNYIYQPG